MLFTKHVCPAHRHSIYVARSPHTCGTAHLPSDLTLTRWYSTHDGAACLSQLYNCRRKHDKLNLTGVNCYHVSHRIVQCRTPETNGAGSLALSKLTLHGVGQDSLSQHNSAEDEALRPAPRAMEPPRESARPLFLNGPVANAAKSGFRSWKTRSAAQAPVRDQSAGELVWKNL